MKSRWWAVVIILIAAWLLFWQLGAKSFWVDEFFTLYWIQEDLASLVSEVAADLHPPLYFVLLHFWGRLVGYSEFGLRAFSVLVGVLSLALVYRLGRSFGMAHWGLVAAYLMAISPFFVLYGRMARYYPLALLLGLLSCYFFARLLRGGSKWDWNAYFLASEALIYTSYPAVSLLVAQTLFLVLRWRKYRAVWGRWLSNQVFLALAFLPWLGIVWKQAARISAGRQAELASGLKGYALKIAFPAYAFAAGETVFPWELAGLAAALLALALFLLGGYRLVRKEPERALFLGLCIFLPLVGTAVIVTFISVSTPFISIPSRTMFAFPFFVLVVAWGMAGFERATVRWGLLLAVTLALLFPLANYYRNRHFVNPVYVMPSREIAAFLAEESQPGDAIFCDEDSGVDYYCHQLGCGTPPLLSTSTEEAITYLEGHRNDRVWLVTLGRDGSWASTPTRLLDWLDEHYGLDLERGYAEQDRTYQKVKEKLLRRPVYRYKITVYRYAKGQGEGK